MREKETNEFIENYGCTTKHFLENEYSICREERQYAVLLYNVLRYYRKAKEREKDKKIKAIFDACQIPAGAEVIQVFYEATFMRDFFERNRRIVLGECNEKQLMNKTFFPSGYQVDSENSFNYKLIQYVHECCKEQFKENEPLKYLDEERNLGRNEICTEISEYEKYIIRCMMEAKPDIAVTYMEKEKKYLLFLECKFGSGEARYEGKVGQRDIQWKIADFLCKNYLKNEEIDISVCMKEKKSCLVRFTRQKRDIQKFPSEDIPICDLIEINKIIFREDDELNGD